MPNFYRRRSLRCMLILWLVLALFLVSCSSVDSGQGNEDVSTTVPELIDTEESETVPAETTVGKTEIDRSYPGYTAILLIDAPDKTVFGSEAVAEQYDLADAERRAILETKLGLSLAVQTEANAADYLAQAALTNLVPDLVELNASSNAGSLITAGHLADLGAIPNFNLENYAIDRSLTDALSIADHTYLLFGDATARDQYAASAVLLNVETAGEVDCSPGDLIYLAKNNRWTIEQWKIAAELGHSDLNGDAVLPFFVGTGGKIFSKTEKDIPAITVDSAFSRAYAAMQQAMGVPSVEGDGTVLFRVGTLRELADGWIALPMPAVSVGETYRTSVDPSELPCLVVPALQTDAARTGDILTVYFEFSTDTVKSVVRDSLVARQVAAGGDAEMIDLILQNRFCSHGALFGWGALTESLSGSVGLEEADFLKKIDMQMTAASRAMEILVGRLQ
ncbi:MAG: hypothetical protein IKL84_09235 [Clostridia bacterium]|nr:hypothetical protein [Clostridia bacterium]